MTDPTGPGDDGRGADERDDGRNGDDGPTRESPNAQSLPAPSTDLRPVLDALRERGARAFVHVGDRFDDGLRYLTRFAGPDRAYAFVLVDADGGPRAVMCAPALFEAQAVREFVDGAPDDGVERAVRTAAVGDPAGERAVAVLAESLAGSGDGPLVLTPQQLPHDAAVYLERAGYALASTPAVGRARTVKTDAEVDCLRRAQRAAARGMARAEAVLAEATAEGDELHWRGAPLSTERLRRQVNAELAAHGARDAGNTVVGAGPSCADLHFTGLDELRPGETVLLDVSPRGPHGYYGDLTRTFVVAGEGGWERRAYVAVEAAHEAALDALAAGVPARTIHEAAAGELAAFGFAVDDDERGFVHGVGHGVGLSLHEGPSLRADDDLVAGNVVTVEPGVYDPEEGGVRIEDLVLVTDDGYELLGEYPRSMTPQQRLDEK